MAFYRGNCSAKDYTYLVSIRASSNMTKASEGILGIIFSYFDIYF